MKRVILFVDGAYSRSRNVGGYAFVAQYVVDDEVIKEVIFSERVENTTNNRMELQAAIAGLQFLKKPCTVEIVSDSTYLVDTVNKWISAFVKDPTRLNLDLMKTLHQEIKKHIEVTATWVRGHCNNENHNRADKLAQLAADTYKGLKYANKCRERNRKKYSKTSK